MGEPNTFIKCDGLVKIYKTEDVEVFALQGLELEIKKGELMAIVGKSGSGKSTLLSLLGGLETPSAGKLLIDGKNIFDMSEKELVAYRRKMFGFVWQMCSKNLLPYLTACENIEVTIIANISQKEKHNKAMELLKLVGLEGKENKLPSQMSGGEQQRVAIAVALCNEPQILLADEPTGAVDSKTSNQIQDLFARLNRELGITIIIVTHDMQLADKVDRTVMISDGKISTEKVRTVVDSNKGSNEEFSVLDKAGRIQLNEEMLAAAGIDGRRVKVINEDGRLIITGV